MFHGVNVMPAFEFLQFVTVPWFKTTSLAPPENTFMADKILYTFWLKPNFPARIPIYLTSLLEELSLLFHQNSYNSSFLNLYDKQGHCACLS